MDNNNNGAFPSHRSVSWITNSNQELDTSTATAGTSKLLEFVNHGLLLWNQTRQEWIGNKELEKPLQTHGPKLSWNATYENLLRSNKPFPQPIPLAEMVDFLVDIWEQGGLYD